MRSAGIHQLRQDLVLTVNFIERTAGFIRKRVFSKIGCGHFLLFFATFNNGDRAGLNLRLYNNNIWRRSSVQMTSRRERFFAPFLIFPMCGEKEGQTDDIIPRVEFVRS